MADAWHDDGVRPVEIGSRGGHEEIGAEGGERLLDGRQVAGVIVDQCNHSSPFVLGSIRASRRSVEQATRSARANALNTAST